jgi:hypothetical protein
VAAVIISHSYIVLPYFLPAFPGQDGKKNYHSRNAVKGSVIMLLIPLQPRTCFFGFSCHNAMKNSNDPVGNRPRGLPVCSATPQPTAPQRTAWDFQNRLVHQKAEQLTHASPAKV